MLLIFLSPKTNKINLFRERLLNSFIYVIPNPDSSKVKDKNLYNVTRRVEFEITPIGSDPKFHPDSPLRDTQKTLNQIIYQACLREYERLKTKT